MLRLSVLVFLIYLLICLTPPPMLADILVEPWEVDCVVSGPTSQSSVTFIRNENPFQNSHIAQFGLSSAGASYDFAWLGDFAHFDAYTSHHLEQLDGRTVCEGRIRVIPAIDTNISFNGRWQFSWPGSVDGLSLLLAQVYDLVADEPVVNATAIGGNAGLGPPFGTLTVQDSALLLAGGEYEIDYSTLIDHLDPTPPGTHGEGSGEVHFTLTPVPEPATAAMIGIALLARKRLSCRLSVR